MRSISACALVMLFLSASAAGQVPVPPGEVTCPVDGHKFTVTEAEKGDRGGGEDSDGCVHDLKGQGYVGDIVVCPRCNYTMSRGAFGRKLTRQEKNRLLRVLTRSRYRGVADSTTDIPTWERYRLAGQCAAALEKSLVEGESYRRAAWSVRNEACRPASLLYGVTAIISPFRQSIGGMYWTTGIDEIIRQIEGEIRRAGTPVEGRRLTLHLAMMCHRRGVVAKDVAVSRDEVITRLKKTLGADRAIAARVARFEKLIALEKSFLEKYVTVTEKELKEARDKLKDPWISCQLADALRRIGRTDDALEHLREARKLVVGGGGGLNALIDHQLSLIAPGEPVTGIEEKKKEESPAPPTGTPTETKP